MDAVERARVYRETFQTFVVSRRLPQDDRLWPRAAHAEWNLILRDLRKRKVLR